MFPAARVTDFHVCPMVTPGVPPILPPAKSPCSREGCCKPNTAYSCHRRDSESVGGADPGRTPWSARDALVPPVREESIGCDDREADQGVGRGRGRPPHSLCNCPETGKACGILPQARVTDMAMCVGPPDMIVKGSTTVLVGGLPAARILDSEVHGGMIVLGEFTVPIGG